MQSRPVLQIDRDYLLIQDCRNRQADGQRPGTARAGGETARPVTVTGPGVLDVTIWKQASFADGAFGQPDQSVVGSFEFPQA